MSVIALLFHLAATFAGIGALLFLLSRDFPGAMTWGVVAAVLNCLSRVRACGRQDERAAVDALREKGRRISFEEAALVGVYSTGTRLTTGAPSVS